MQAASYLERRLLLLDLDNALALCQLQDDICNEGLQLQQQVLAQIAVQRQRYLQSSCSLIKSGVKELKGLQATAFSKAVHSAGASGLAPGSCLTGRQGSASRLHETVPQRDPLAGPPSAHHAAGKLQLRNQCLFENLHE